MHFWSFWAKYCHSLHILSNAWPKSNVNRVPRWVFRYVGNNFSSKKKDFLPKFGIFGQFGPGHAGLFSALLVGRVVVLARGLYLARHLFTLFDLFYFRYIWLCQSQVPFQQRRRWKVLLQFFWTPSRPKCKRILNRQKYHKKTFFKMISLLSQRIWKVCAMFLYNFTKTSWFGTAIKGKCFLVGLLSKVLSNKWKTALKCLAVFHNWSN